MRRNSASSTPRPRCSPRADSPPPPWPTSSTTAFEANARAYLNAIWANRRAAMVLASGDTPAGFDGVRRSSMLKGFRRWMSVLELDTSPRGQLLTRILIAVMAEASGLVITSEDPADVGPITDATIEWIDRLKSGAPHPALAARAHLLTSVTAGAV